MHVNTHKCKYTNIKQLEYIHNISIVKFALTLNFITKFEERARQ